MNMETLSRKMAATPTDQIIANLNWSFLQLLASHATVVVRFETRSSGL